MSTSRLVILLVGAVCHLQLALSQEVEGGECSLSSPCSSEDHCCCGYSIKNILSNATDEVVSTLDERKALSQEVEGAECSLTSPCSDEDHCCCGYSIKNILSNATDEVVSTLDERKCVRADECLPELLTNPAVLLPDIDRGLLGLLNPVVGLVTGVVEIVQQPQCLVEEAVDGVTDLVPDLVPDEAGSRSCTGPSDCPEAELCCCDFRFDVVYLIDQTLGTIDQALGIDQTLRLEHTVAERVCYPQATCLRVYTSAVESWLAALGPGGELPTIEELVEPQCLALNAGSGRAAVTWKKWIGILPAFVVVFNALF